MGDAKAVPVVDTNKPSVSVSNGVRTETPKCDKIMEPEGSLAEIATQEAKATGGDKATETKLEEKGEY